MSKKHLKKFQDESLRQSFENAKACTEYPSGDACKERAAFYHFMTYWAEKKEQFPEFWVDKGGYDHPGGGVKVFAENLGFHICQGMGSDSKALYKDIAIPASYSSSEAKVVTAKALVQHLLRPLLSADDIECPADGSDLGETEMIMKASAAALLLSKSSSKAEINLHESLPKPYMTKWLSCWEEGRNFESGRLAESY